MNLKAINVGTIVKFKFKSNLNLDVSTIQNKFPENLRHSLWEFEDL